MEITYTRVGDYLHPDLILSDPPYAEALTKYGRMRRTYLKDHRKVFFNHLLLTEKLYPHLRDIQRAAESRLETMMVQFAKNSPPPDKAVDNLAWAAHMNMLKAQVEEIILSELIYY